MILIKKPTRKSFSLYSASLGVRGKFLCWKVNSNQVIIMLDNMPFQTSALDKLTFFSQCKMCVFFWRQVVITLILINVAGRILKISSFKFLAVFLTFRVRLKYSECCLLWRFLKYLSLPRSHWSVLNNPENSKVIPHSEAHWLSPRSERGYQLCCWWMRELFHDLLWMEVFCFFFWDLTVFM